MKAKLSLLLIILQLLLVSCDSNEAKNNGKREFDQEQIDRLNQSNRYDYDKTIKRKDNPILSFFGQILAFIARLFTFSVSYIVIGGLLILIVWLIVKNTRAPVLSVATDKGDVRLISEEQLENTNYLPLLEMALKENNYRLAIRFSFILALQNLQKKGEIQWEKEKTNHQYLMELPLGLQKPFSALTRIYEYVWYGEAEANETLYKRIQQHLFQLKKNKAA